MHAPTLFHWPRHLISFPSVELTNSRATDLHFHIDADTTWILLLDVTAERDATRRVQQRAHEMTLLQEKEALLNRRLEAINAALLSAQQELQTFLDMTRRELERKQVELAEARTLQLALVPPSYQGVLSACPVMIDVTLEPAKEVGGDLVDHFVIENDLLVLLLSDVSDKGAGAALMMARTHALFRGIMMRPDAAGLFRAPEKAVHLVNATLAEDNASCMFVTLLIAVFDATTNQLAYTRAGHVPPFLHRTSGLVERLSAAGGPPLGLTEAAVYRSASVDLAPGDELLIVTDGVTEAMDPSQRLFGDVRVADVMSHRSCPQTSLLQQLLMDVQCFEAGSPQSDDIAAILLTVGTAPSLISS